MWKYTVKDEGAKQRIAKKITEIAKHLEKESTLDRQPGLHTGSVGAALFLFYYARFSKDKKYSEIAFIILFNT